MEMELLINLVRENRELYVTCHEDYKFAKLKDNIWRRIAQELNYPNLHTAKTRWRKLRDCHRDALRRQKQKLDMGQPITKMWLYQKQMEFLIPYMQPYTSIAKCYTDADDDEDDDSEVRTHCEAVLNQEEDRPNDDDNQITIEDVEPDKTELLMASPPSGNKNIFEITTLMKETVDTYDQRSTVQRDIPRKRVCDEKIRKEVEYDDALYQFFMSMYNITRNMPKLAQLHVKKKIFEAVSEVEEDLIRNPPT